MIREKSVLIPVNREFSILIPVNSARHRPPPLSDPLQCQFKVAIVKMVELTEIAALKPCFVELLLFLMATMYVLSRLFVPSVAV